MINLHYTKNILDGRLVGAQLRTTIPCDDAQDAVSWMLLIVDGVQHDLMLGAGYTAHNFRFETELGHDLGECGGAAECAWCREEDAYAAADFKMELLDHFAGSCEDWKPYEPPVAEGSVQNV